MFKMLCIYVLNLLDETLTFVGSFITYAPEFVPKHTHTHTYKHIHTHIHAHRHTHASLTHDSFTT